MQFGIVRAADNSTGWHNLGCYNDSVADRALSQIGIVVGGPANMSVENCEAGCLSAGYRLAGVEYSGECYCDNKFRNNGGPASDGNAECTMTCSGAPKETCGGPDRLNVYSYAGSITSAPPPPTGGGGGPTPTTTIPIPTSIPTGWKYQGCYHDNIGYGRVMANGQPDNPNMSVESCIAVCINKGYTVAGMEYSSQCFCDDYLRDNTTRTDSDTACAMRCSGDSGEICGGPNLLSVYSKGDLRVLPVPKVQTENLPGSWKYKGCLQ